jgi:uncharacterized protein
MHKKIFEKIKKETRKFFRNSKGCHDWDHTERVYNLALHIGRKEKADLEIIEIAALLHDIARGHQDKVGGKICHAEKGAEMARIFLKRYGFPEEKIEKIARCIKCHRFRGKNIPESKEAKVLFDADKLDAIGAIGIGRAFVFSGEVGARVHDINVNISKTKEYSREDTAYREFLVKLSKIKGKMLTKEGKRIAKERHRFMVNFFGRLNSEVQGKI